MKGVSAIEYATSRDYTCIRLGYGTVIKRCKKFVTK